MCDEQISQWITFGVGSWTKFDIPISESIDESLFEPLLHWKTSFRRVYYGRIAETPGKCILVVGWTAHEAYENFRDSSQFREMMDNLKAKSPQGNNPQTHITVCWNTMFFRGFGPNTEIVTAYLPTSSSLENQTEAKTVTRLVHTSAGGKPASLAYRRGPSFGWVFGTQTWDGEAVFACMWSNNWQNKQGEEDLKRREKRDDPEGGPDKIPVLEAFEKDLKRLGFVGWESYHADLVRIFL